MNQLALREFMYEQAPLPQVLGKTDCVTFVTGCILAGWDKNVFEYLEFRDRKSAVVQLRQSGGLLLACREKMGTEEDIAGLPIGSVVYFHTPRPTLGLLMEHFIVVKAHKQILRIKRLEGLKGWRIN